MGLNVVFATTKLLLRMNTQLVVLLQSVFFWHGSALWIMFSPSNVSLLSPRINYVIVGVQTVSETLWFFLSRVH